MSIACIVGSAFGEDQSLKSYVDMGLPSGTLWKSKDEPGGLYTQTEAMEKFGDKLPTEEQIRELVNSCKWTWDGGTYTYKVVGPNGKSIIFKATGTWPCEPGYNGFYECDRSRIILENSGGCWSSSMNWHENYGTYYHLYFDPSNVNVYSAMSICGIAVRLVDKGQSNLEEKVAERKKEEERLAAESRAREQREAEKRRRKDAELRKQEEQRRQVEENNRRIAYSNELNNMVDAKGAVFSATPTEMKYEFILEDETPKRNKPSQHLFVLSYNTQSGRFYMSALNWTWDELSVIFPMTGLEGSAEKWKNGEFGLGASFSRERIAGELSRILGAMAKARDTYNSSVIEKRLKKKEQQRRQYGSWSMANLLAYPCGATYYEWKEAKKQSQSLCQLHSGLRGSKSGIVGNFSGEDIEIGDNEVLRPFFTSINFGVKGCKISVQYNFMIKQGSKTVKNSDEIIVKEAVNFVNAVLEDKLKFEKQGDGSYKIANLKDKVMIDNLRVSVDSGQIIICYHIVKFLK